MFETGQQPDPCSAAIPAAAPSTCTCEASLFWGAPQSLCLLS